MIDLNLTDGDLETLYKVSQSIDNVGNLTLGIATILGLVSIDIVLLVAIFNSDKDNRHRRDDVNWELFWFSRWYSDRCYHHCCHHEYNSLTRRMAYHDDYSFIAATVFVSLICTVVAIFLALHFHLFTLAFILAGVWGAGLALKGLAYAICPNLPEAQVVEEDLIPTTADIPEAPMAHAEFDITPSAPPLAFDY